MESDYLLGVHDEFRSGALRYKLEDNEAFLADDIPSAAPPFVRLRELEAASRALEEGADDNPQLDAQLLLLLAPGASLGGARPKATVSDSDGNLWIAKFPSGSDRYDTGAWEYVVHQLALRSGIRASEAQVRRFSDKGHTFLVRRFDREGGQGRIHYASAMTLTGRVDGEDASYLEIAEVIASQGSQAKADLEELWTRIAFNVLVSNTDDHLRNHGFLLTPNGWRLAPAFDMNPDPTGTGLALDIDESDNALDLNLVRSVAHYFRVSNADAILDRLDSAISTWRNVAQTVGIPESEQDAVALAFRNPL
ncbi:MAG TPA: HipA domain-containing protein [Candidatus Baltobacteraceae bacterium]